MTTNAGKTEDRRNYNNYPRAGLGNANSYLVAGTPYVTGAATIAVTSQHKIVFPRVAREVVVVNKAAPDLRVYFTDMAAGTSTFDGLHYVTLTENRDSWTFRCKCKEIYIYNADGSDEGAYELYAEITHIDSDEMYILTGSGLTIGKNDANYPEPGHVGGSGAEDG
tara:strand:- start:437 stop:934 length:498 start_codon:yes stop_codon:yes gene_type:complete